MYPAGRSRNPRPGPNRSAGAVEPRRATSPRSGASWRSDVRQPRNDASGPTRWVLTSGKAIYSPPVTDLAHGEPPTETERAWLTRGVAGIGRASLLADLGHEIPTALLPSFLTSTLGAPAAALGLIEGIADGLAARRSSPAARSPTTRTAGARPRSAATRDRRPLGADRRGHLRRGRSASCAPAPGPRAASACRRETRCSPTSSRRPPTAAPTASSARWTTSARSAARCSRSRSSPSSACASAILLSIIPGLLAAVAILYAIRHPERPPAPRERATIRLHVRPVLRGRLGRAVHRLARSSSATWPRRC